MARKRTQTDAFSLFSFQDIITSVTGIMVLITLIMSLDIVAQSSHSPSERTKTASTETQSIIAELRSQIQLAQSKLDEQNRTVGDVSVEVINDLRQKIKQFQLEFDSYRVSGSQKSKLLIEREQVLNKKKQSEEIDEANDQATLEDLTKEIDDLKIKLQDIEKQDRMYFRYGVTGKTCWVLEIAANQARAGVIGKSEPPKVFSSNESLSRWLRTLNRSTEAVYLVVKPGGEIEFARIREKIRGSGIEFGFTVEPTNRIVLDPNTGAG